GAHGFCRAVQTQDVHALPLERRVVAITLRDGPVEEVPNAGLEPVQSDMAAFGAPRRKGGSPPQSCRHGLLSSEQLLNLACGLPGRLDSRQSCGKHCIEVGAAHRSEWP